MCILLTFWLLSKIYFLPPADEAPRQRLKSQLKPGGYIYKAEKVTLTKHLLQVNHSLCSKHTDQENAPLVNHWWMSIYFFINMLQKPE